MNKIAYFLFAWVTLTSCASSFDIQGTSNISTLDGRKLYLKVSQILFAQNWTHYIFQPASFS